MNGFWIFLAHLGVGLLPGPTGTWGSALGTLIFAGVYLAWPIWGGWLLVVVSSILGIKASFAGEAVWGHDSGHIIIDEVAGQALTLSIGLLVAPFGWWPLIAGFFLFRLFDIAKFWPMSAAEKLPGGYGVMVDDLVAGLLAGLCLAGLGRIFG